MVGEEIALKAAEKASENIVEFEGDVFREVKHGRKSVLVPVRVKVGINPLSLITAAAAGLAGALAATVAWHGVSFPGFPGTPSITLFRGLKQTSLGRDLNRAYENYQSKRLARELGTLSSRCSDAKTGRDKFQRMLDDNPPWLTPDVRRDITEQIRTLDTFIAEECAEDVSP